MRITLSFLSLVLLFHALAGHAHAIILLPAVILIPIAKIVAVVIAGFAIPALGLGTIWGRLFNKPIIKILSGIIVGLLLLGVFLVIYLKLENPARPLF